MEECLDLIKQKKLFLAHCSAGIGRTGTFGAVIEGLRLGRETGTLSVVKIVDNMRRYRMSCVQTF